MGNNHSKLCSGFPEREIRRALQERSERLYATQQAKEALSDTTVHIHCREDEVDQFLEEMNTAPLMFHFKVEKVLEVKPENPLEGDEIPALAKKPGAVETVAAVLPGIEVAEPSGNAIVIKKSEASGDVMVTLEPHGDILVWTDAHPSEVDMHMVKKSFRDSSERTKHSSVEDVSPSSLEPQFSILSLDSQTTSPPIGADELQNTRDVHHPNKDTFLAHDCRAPCETGHELAMGNVLGVAEEPATGQMRLEDASSAEILGDGSKAPPDLGSVETCSKCSDGKTELGRKELAEILLSLGNYFFRAMSEPLIRNEMEEKGRCDMENMETRLEEQPNRAQSEVLARVDSEDKTEQPGASKIFQTNEFHGGSTHTPCKKANGDEVLLSSDAVELDSLQTDGASPRPEATKGNEHQTKVQNMQTRPLTDVAAMTIATFSPKALLGAAEMGQGGSLFYSAEPIGQVSRTQDNHTRAQSSPVPGNVSGPPLDGGSLVKGAELLALK